MVLSGHTVVVVAVLLAAWFVFLWTSSWRAFRIAPSRNHIRSRATAGGLLLSAIAVLATLTLDLSWLSADISQRVTFSVVRAIAMLIFWPSLIGLFLCIIGISRIRFVGVASCLLTSCWWLVLMTGSAISMGAMPVARHPVKYLIPDGYVGWVKIKRGENAAPLPLVDGKYICRIPPDGTLATSTVTEDGWATDEYFYDSGDNNFTPLRETSWGDGGMIWGGTTEFGATAPGSRPTRMTENIFIGTEAQYRHSTGQ